MGEIRFAWNKNKNELSIIGDILLLATGIYFTVQSVNNMGFFYYMYIKPIVDFIDSNIIPLFLTYKIVAEPIAWVSAPFVFLITSTY